ncbi:hypothetical protein [Saccharopolyspora rosea]|uniref:hypothetical protein n=1 Tax=Saccharopolyspora rosea TaxID=524884 RepID=UPI0021DA88BC|nr:hypothetical protein [Saccharopolyspora rosea]
MTDTLAQQQAAGLRALADMIETNPELAESARWSFDGLLVPVEHTGAARAAIDRFANAAVTYGASVTAEADEKWSGINVSWGALRLYVYASRATVDAADKAVPA